MDPNELGHAFKVGGMQGLEAELRRLECGQQVNLRAPAESHTGQVRGLRQAKRWHDQGTGP